MDATRFEAIFRAHHRAVLGFALRRADPDTAQEVVADTFLVCWRRLDDVPADARPWLFGVARRCLANRRRGDARQRALEARVAEPGTAGDPFGERLDIHAAFRRLSERDREALALVAWEGLDHAAAARALGCSRPRIRCRSRRMMTQSGCWRRSWRSRASRLAAGAAPHARWPSWLLNVR